MTLFEDASHRTHAVHPREELTQTRAEAKNWFDECRAALAEINIELSLYSDILELGAGKGVLYEVLKDAGYNIQGVEPRRRVDTPKEIRDANAESMPFFRDDSFNLVIARGVFDSMYEHDAEKILKEVFRVLKPNGVFYGLLKGDQAFAHMNYQQLAESLGFTVLPDLHSPYLILLKHSYKASVT